MELLNIITERIIELLLKDTKNKIVNKVTSSILDSIHKTLQQKEIRNDVKIFLKKRKLEITNNEASNYIDFTTLNNILLNNLNTRIIKIIYSPSSRIEEQLKDELISEITNKAIININNETILSECNYIIYHYIETVIQLVKKHYKDNIYTYIQDSTRELEHMIQILNETFILQSNNLSYENSFAQWIDNIKKIEMNEKKLHYLNKHIGFYGREKEIMKVNKFLDSNTNLSILGITGEGGSGKSKFMYNYIERENYRRNWKMLFVPNAMIDKLIRFNNWYYGKNLLLVFDYAARNAEIIGKFIELIANSSSVKNKIRIVLLEREGITKNTDMYPYWYSRLSDNGRNHYVIDYTEFLNLEILSKEALLSISDDYKEFLFLYSRDKERIKNTVVYRNFKNQSFNEKYRNKIYSIASDISKTKITPLIMMMVTEAAIYGIKNINHWLKEKNPSNWTPIELARIINERDKIYWKDSIDGLHIQLLEIETLLAYATAIEGWKLNFNKCSKIEKEFIEKVFPRKEEILSIVHMLNENNMNDTSLYIDPKEPDFIGEVFVFDFIKRNIMYSDSINRFIRLLWDKPEAFFSFLYRCSKLILEPEYRNLLQENIPFYKPIDYKNKTINEYYASMLGEILYYPSSKEIADTLYLEFKKIPLDLTEERNAVKYITVLLNYSTYQDELEKRLKLIEKVEVFVNKFPDSKDIYKRYTKMLFNITAKYEDIEILYKVLDKIEHVYLYYQGEDIARFYALSLYNVSFSEKDIHRFKQLLLKYINVYHKFSLNNDIIKYMADFLCGFSLREILDEDCEWVIQQYEELLNKTNHNKYINDQYMETMNNIKMR